jgi:hypothetical protein
VEGIDAVFSTHCAYRVTFWSSRFSVAFSARVFSSASRYNYRTMAKPPDIRPAPVAELLPGEDLALLGGQEAVEQKAHLSPMG